MNIENEFIGEINKEIFQKKLQEFTAKFGEPEVKKRLGLMVFDRNNPHIDTRIRITNGKAEIMQKVLQDEDGQGHSQKDEISLDIPNNTESVYRAFVSYTNLLKPKYGKQLIRLIVQTENYLWQTEDYELKLSYQFGKSDYYTFEIEALNSNCDIKAVQIKLGLVPTENHASPKRKLFRVTSVDLNAEELTESEIKKIIDSYLD